MLRRLLQTDAAAMLGILDESLTGWDALEADLRSTAGLAAVADGEGRSATQVRSHHSAWYACDGHSEAKVVSGFASRLPMVSSMIDMH